MRIVRVFDHIEHSVHDRRIIFSPELCIEEIDETGYIAPRLLLMVFKASHMRECVSCRFLHNCTVHGARRCIMYALIKGGVPITQRRRQEIRHIVNALVKYMQGT